MIETRDNDSLFKELFRGKSLDDVMEALEEVQYQHNLNLHVFSRLNDAFSKLNDEESEPLSLIPSLYTTRIIPSCINQPEIDLARTGSAIMFYERHQLDCNEAIAKWNGETK